MSFFLIRARIDAKEVFGVKWKVKLLISIVVILLVFIGFVMYQMRFMNKLYFEDGNNNQEIGKTIEINSNYYTIEYPKIGNKNIDKKIDKIVSKFKKSFNKNNYSYVNYETYLAPDHNIGIVFIKTVEKNDQIIKEDIETKILIPKMNKKKF